MEQSFELADSTDWIDTPLNLLGPLESSLRCQICKDFFTSPVITSCCHTFCSLCIRRCLSSDHKCPVCRQADQELKLRRNWTVEELLENFKKARPSVLGLARKEAARIKNGGDDSSEPSPKKRKVNHLDEPEPPAALSPRRVRTRSRGAKVQADPTHGQEEIEESDVAIEPEVIEDSQDEDYSDDGLVPCPICNRRVRQDTINTHLDTCLAGDSPKPPPVKSSTAFGYRHPQGSELKKLERLPAINYSLFKEHALRKKMRDLGISDAGPKPLLQRRHTEWMNLWNANCDSKNPKSKSQLARELDTWERTQGGNAVPSAPERNPVTSKDFNAAQWSANHNDEFKLLIANARKKSDAQVRSTIPRVSESSNAAAEIPSPTVPSPHFGTPAADQNDSTPSG
ncbi:postreplication repair E3 ubiquitin-protein ligase rad18 [Penicillium chermesinum]|uniref:Postreplication repair E3 ubiquitin-protein ligase RAD18 n=1 Tax=Penicillium chermesinum TaxID=63820 RepID=A0A9W9P771_9EURO|nr:postreplication repair E3 ubiquitin-protein ligase rad18 [Penicillium chermesinum]KAJ5239239.1 postreplication repair E3 ubiquitin-protein ligase rad18 [Penicillium chermesinum]